MDNTATPVLQQTERPMSPHLGIYKWQLTMTLSILHRATGVALSVGTILLVWLLIALAAGADSYRTIHVFCISPVGLFLLAGWTWALFFHLCNGVRHLLWDVGWGFRIPRVYATGWTAVVASFVLTVVVWVMALKEGAA